MLAIGGNHTIHGCRRNIWLNHILINNFIYALTNSQTSPTTPRGMWTVTAQYGNIDPSFDACKLATAAGATFVARGNVIEPEKLTKLFVQGFKHDGYSFFDVFSNCHINLGRKNKMGEAVQNLEWIKKRTMNKAKFDTLTDDERAQLGEIYPLGVLHEDDSKTEYTKAYAKVIAAARDGVKIDFKELV